MPGTDLHVTERHHVQGVCPPRPTYKVVGSDFFRPATLLALPAYAPLHPDVYSLAETDLEPTFLSAWRSADPAAWDGVTREVHPGVHVFRLLTPEACWRLDEEIAHREAWALLQSQILEPPNGMHGYGVILDQIGFESLLQELTTRWLGPLATRLFPEHAGDRLDEHHGFLADYGQGRDQELGFHVDDSEVTLNLCLGERFTGSELVFRGLRCARHLQTEEEEGEVFAYEHEPGVAVLHAGMHRHQVQPVRSGRRRNLILWCRSSQLREQGTHRDCPSWCGRHA